MEVWATPAWGAEAACRGAAAAEPLRPPEPPGARLQANAGSQASQQGSRRRVKGQLHVASVLMQPLLDMLLSGSR